MTNATMVEYMNARYNMAKTKLTSWTCILWTMTVPDINTAVVVVISIATNKLIAEWLEKMLLLYSEMGTVMIF